MCSNLICWLQPNTAPVVQGLETAGRMCRVRMTDLFQPRTKQFRVHPHDEELSEQGVGLRILNKLLVNFNM